MKKIPVLLSIPHGGMAVPAELRDRACINKFDLHDDIDPFVQEIYDLGEKVVEVIKTDIARTFVDLNRAPDDRPPQNPDGVVKSTTCYRKLIYLAGKEPDDQLTSILLKRYYEPYHERICQALKRPEIELALDCHSMLPIGPAISPDTGGKRPTICLGDAHGRACPREMIEKLVVCFREAYSLAEKEVTINKPFAGGYITRTYGGNSIPWVQVEINRALYLNPRWFDHISLTIDETRLSALKNMFKTALQEFFR